MFVMKFGSRVKFEELRSCIFIFTIPPAGEDPCCGYLKLSKEGRDEYRVERLKKITDGGWKRIGSSYDVQDKRVQCIVMYGEPN